MAPGIVKLLSFAKPKRRWAQFSLGTMLLAVTLLCVWLADYVSPVRKLERQLRDPNDSVRKLAAERLGYMGSDARSTTRSLLVRAREDASTIVRAKAVWALSRVSGRADLLEPLLDDSDHSVSSAALEGLLWLGEDPAKLIHRQFHDTADYALAHIATSSPATVPALAQRLDHARPEVRRAAAEQLLRLGGSAKQAAPALRSRLDDPDQKCAVICAAALCAIEPSDADAIRVLKGALRSDDPLRFWASDYLGALGPDAAVVLDDLVAYACDANGFGAWSFGTVLGIGPPAVDALDHALRQAMAERDGYSKSIPGYLGQFGPAAKPAVPTLIRALDYADFRNSSIQALGRIGKDAAPAVPQLAAFLDSEDVCLSAEAFIALQRIGVSDEEVRARLRSKLASSDRYERVDAALLLASFGETDERVLPALIELAIDPHPDDRAWLTGESYSARDESITSMASLGPTAVSGLIAALKDSDPLVRRVAAEALGKMGPSANQAVPRLIELLDDEASWDAAAEALGRIGRESRAAVPKLLKAFEALRKPLGPSDYDPAEYNPDDWRDYVTNEYLPRLNALAGIGAEARAAVPEILKLANSYDRQIRQAAVLTLARIDPTHPSLIGRMRRLLLEWERKSAMEDSGLIWSDGDPLEKIPEAVWNLGRHAEPLAVDLERIVTAKHLVNFNVRCYAAFALASFLPHRQTAETYLESVVNSNSFGSKNLAQGLLQRIKGEPKSVLWGGPWENDSQETIGRWR